MEDVWGGPPDIGVTRHRDGDVVGAQVNRRSEIRGPLFYIVAKQCSDEPGYVGRESRSKGYVFAML